MKFLQCLKCEILCTIYAPINLRPVGTGGWGIRAMGGENACQEFDRKFTPL